MKDSNPKGAIEQYFLLLDSEEPMSEKAWSAKCINEIISIKIKKNHLDDMIEVVKKLLTYINNMSKYDRGITIDCIFNAVNKISNLAKKKEVGRSHQAFETLLAFLKEKDMTVIWMSTSLKLARIYLTNQQRDKFDEVFPSQPRL
jgi:hypothetical protein